MKEPPFLVRQIIVHGIAAVCSAALLWIMAANLPRTYTTYIVGFGLLTVLTAFFPVHVGLIYRPAALVFCTAMGGITGFCLGAFAWGCLTVRGLVSQYQSYSQAVREDDSRGTLTLNPVRDMYVYPTIATLVTACVLAAVGFWLTDYGNALTRSEFGRYLGTLYVGHTEEVSIPSFGGIARIALTLEFSFALLYRLTTAVLSGGFTIPKT